MRVFVLAAAGAMSGELIALLAWQHGTDLWMTSPHPLLAFLLLLGMGVFMPISGMTLLWLEEKSLVRFLLLAVAAALFAIGMLMAIGATLGLHAGERFSEMVIGYLPMLIVIACFYQYARLKFRTPTMAMR